jgi:hypothetical protein
MKKTQNEGPWTQFMDMHSGGGLKEDSLQYIYIQAPYDEAVVIFYNIFGHSPHRVTCTCCGEDYSVTESKDFQQASGFERGCDCLLQKQDPDTRRYQPLPEGAKTYWEEGEEPPPGFEFDTRYGKWKDYRTVDEYLKREDVKVIYKEDIPDDARKGAVPEQGYVWVD